MAHVAWTLVDNSTGSPETFSFPINPNSFDPPNRRANIVEEMTTAGSGGVVLFQGRDTVRRGSMSGAVRDSSFFTDLETWSQKWYPLVLTDDLDQSWNIIITEVTWKRVKRQSHPYRFDYTINFIVL